MVYFESSMLDILLIILIGVLLVGNAIFVVVVLRRLNKTEVKEDSQSFSLLFQQMNDLTKTVDQKIGEGARQMNETVRNQFGDSQKLVREITAELTQVKETGRQVVSFAEQLRSLQDILKNPKQRGVLGEYYLETLLKNVMPPGSFQMQYAFSDGKIVDAAVFVKGKVIPVDSKFSLENYNRMAETTDKEEHSRLEKIFVADLKTRVQETAQYIRPSEKTTEFAFMFIPHEAIYYDLLVNKIGSAGEETENIIQRAAGKHKVIIVSPTSFLAYLQTVLQGLKALEIEEKAQDIIKRVEDLGRHIGTYDKFWQSLGKSLSTTVGHYNKAGKELKKIDKDVLRIAGESANLEVVEVERPEEE